MFQRLQRGGWPYPQPPNVQFELNEDSPQAEGLVGWWSTLGGRGGNIVPDPVRGNSADLTNNPTWSLDPIMGWGLELDSDDAVLVPRNPSVIDPPEDSFSLAVWIRWDGEDGSDYQTVAAKRANWPNVQWQLTYEEATNNLLWQSGVGSRILPALQVGGRHIVVTQDTANARCYFNGELVDTEASINWAGAAANPVGIGALWSGAVWMAGLNGAIYDSRLYERILPPSLVWQMARPPTMWELYRPKLRRVWVLAPAVPPVGPILTTYAGYAVPIG